MSRNVTTQIMSEVAKRVISPRIFVKLDLKTTPLFLWSGLGDISWSASTWQGAGELLGLSNIVEHTDGTASSSILSLTGVPSSMVALAYSEEYQGRTAEVWFGTVDDAGAVIADPVRILFGTMDTLSDETDATTSTFALSVQKGNLDQRLLRVWRLTDEHQRFLYPGDKGLQFVAGLAEKPIRWGASS